MSLELAPFPPPTVDSPRRQLRPLILVERAKNLQLQRGGSSAVCGPSQQGPLTTPTSSPQAIDFPRKVIINKPNSLFRAKSEDALPTPPQTPTSSADSHENERGRSNSVLQYHLPFRTIRLSSSPEPASALFTAEDTVISISNSGTSINSGGGLRAYHLDSHATIEPPDKSTIRSRDSIPSFPPRPASRMSWCSTTTTSSDKTIMATSSPWISNSHPRHHHRSQSFGNGQSRISFESRGSSGTFGLATKDSAHSVLDQDSIAEVSEEDLGDAGADERAININDQGDFDSSTPTIASSKLLPVAAIDKSSLGRPPMKQLFPVQAVVAEAEQSTNDSIDAQVSSFKFPSFPPNSSIQNVLTTPASYPNMRMAISAPTVPGYSTCDLATAPLRHRVFSLPTCMHSTSPTETGVLIQDVGRDLPTDSLAPLGHPTMLDTRPRRMLRKSASPSVSPIVPTSNPSTISSTRTIRPPHRQHGTSLPTDDLLREVVLRRESSTTVDTADTGDTTTSTGTVTSKRLRFRKSIGNLFNRVFLERRALRGGINAP